MSIEQWHWQCKSVKNLFISVHRNSSCPSARCANIAALIELFTEKCHLFHMQSVQEDLYRLSERILAYLVPQNYFRSKRKELEARIPPNHVCTNQLTFFFHAFLIRWPIFIYLFQFQRFCGKCTSDSDRLHRSYILTYKIVVNRTKNVRNREKLTNNCGDFDITYQSSCGQCIE